MNRLNVCAPRRADSRQATQHSVFEICPERRSRHGQTSPIIVVLLTLILVAVVALIVVIVMGTGGSTPIVPKPAPKSAAVKDGETVRRDELPVQPAAPPKAIAKPERIKESLQAGKTYRVVLKESFQSRVEDSDWGLKIVVNITFAGEHEILRKIESNDGMRIVELRHFAKAVWFLVQVFKGKFETDTARQVLIDGIPTRENV